ncbi:HAD-IA family hydrolase [Marinoscillum sp.]|uniref:HAD-IA family hydrolase n=1 Tax=Marinoscillum sp. TaxID=2024838 RepID=UPI003BADA65D
MKHRLAELDTIIFDLGEVIVDLNTRAVLEEFSRLTKTDGAGLKEVLMNTPHLFLYETGQIDDQTFASEMSREMNTSINYEDFKFGWNLMIKDIPIQRLEFINKLKETHQVLILSNTNAMHEEKFEAIMQERIGMKMMDLAHIAYYSHHIGYRKPNHDIYEFVLAKNSLNPEKTIFLDDREDNILAAKEVGIRTQQVMHPDQIFEILSYD